jgi:cytosine/adenosine deaminase-related metal-dependent hydrolase
VTPVHDPVVALVLFANGSDVDTVFVDGKIVKQGGKLTNVDWPKLREEVRDSAKRIMDRSTKAPMAKFVETASHMIVEDRTHRKL